MSHELEEEALQREKEQEHQVRAGQAAAAAKERQQAEELRAKDQQVTELQVRNKTKRLHLFGVNSMRSLVTYRAAQQLQVSSSFMFWKMCLARKPGMYIPEWVPCMGSSSSTGLPTVCDDSVKTLHVGTP